jgi:signal transduction histidine kinase
MSRFRASVVGTKYVWWTLTALAVVVIAVTLVGTLKSRRDSYNLLVQQGTAFTEALALACQNTVVSESYYDRLTADHYGDLVDDLVGDDARRLTVHDITEFVRRRGLFGAYIYDSTGQLSQSDVAQGPVIRPPVAVETAVRKLVSDFASRSTTVFIDDTATTLKIHYFIEVTNQLDRVIVLAADASLYDDARARTGIGVLAQSMAEEPGIEYIVYQSREGIIVSSRRNGTFEAIESDTFLLTALESDTIMTRRTAFQDREVLELVRPFATKKYPFGLLRVGVSLEGYVTVSRGFDRVMVILAVALFGLLAIGMLYLSSHRERADLRRDITEIRSVTDQIFAEISTGVAVIGSDGRVRLANRAMEKMIAISLQERWIIDIAAELPAGLADLMGTHSDIEEREIKVSVGGADRILLVGRSVLSPRDTANAGVVLVATDITQLKEYEATVARRERLSEMGHLAAAVAHEIRNPLNAISIAAQRLESEIVPVDHCEDFIGFTGQIRSETRRLNEIITRFLSLARVGAGTPSSADLPNCFAEFEKLVTAEAIRLGIKLTVSSPAGLCVGVDAAKIREVLLNLYNNAKEAVESANGPVREISVSASRRDEKIRIMVADSGPGIPLEHRSRVFAPYFTTKESGTGIGLAAVHQIVEGQGGQVSIEDSELGGAAIVVEFPDQPN